MPGDRLLILVMVLAIASAILSGRPEPSEAVHALVHAVQTSFATGAAAVPDDSNALLLHDRMS